MKPGKGVVLPVSIFVSIIYCSEAFADYVLNCKAELPGGDIQEERYDIVIKGASSFTDACNAVRNDPMYADYGDCKDASGAQGRCRN